MQQLNKKEQSVYDYIKKNIREHGYSPSVRDIREAIGVKSTSTVHRYIERLMVLGYIRKEDGKSRTLRLGEDEETDRQVIFVPVVKSITKDRVFEKTGETVRFCSDKRVDPGSLFAFETKEGNSDAGIMIGDLIIAQKCDSCAESVAAVASASGELTLKYLSDDGYPTKMSDDNMMVGRAIALIRKF